MATIIDEEKKRKISTAKQSILSGAEPMPSVQPESKNYADFVAGQPPVMQTVGELIGGIGRGVSDTASTAGNAVGAAAKSAYETPIPNMLPAYANKASELVAGVQSGFTGDKYVPRKFEAKSIADGVNALADFFSGVSGEGAGAKPAARTAAAPAPAAKPSGNRVLEQTAATKPNDPSRKTPQMEASASNAVLDSLGIADQKGYRRLTGGIYDTGNAEIYGRSNRADGKLNDFAGAGIAGRMNWENRPENAQAVQDAQTRVLTSPGISGDLSAARAAAAARGDFEGAINSIDTELAAGKTGPRAALDRMLADLRKMPLNTSDEKSRYRLKLAEYEKAAGIANESERNSIAGEFNKGRLGIDRQKLDADVNSPERGIASMQYDLYQDLASGDPKKMAAAQAKMKAMNAKGNKYIPLMGKDEMGNPVYMGAFDEATGQAVMGSGQNGTQAVTREQVDAAAKAKGITDPKELQRLYVTYGIQ